MAGQVTGKGCADAAGDRRVGAALSGAGQQNPRGGVPHPAGRGGRPDVPQPSAADTFRCTQRAVQPGPEERRKCSRSSPAGGRRQPAATLLIDASQPDARTQPITTPTRPPNIHRCESWRIGSARPRAAGADTHSRTTTWPLPGARPVRHGLLSGSRAVHRDTGFSPLSRPFPARRPSSEPQAGMAARFSLRRILVFILVFTVNRGYQDTFGRARLDRSLPGFRIG